MNRTPSQLEWVAPSPMWPGAASLAAEPRQMRAPAILRFTSDQFVDELRQAVAVDPVVLPIATWESARVPPTGTADPLNWKATRPANAPLKLFQPIHGRFYMVAASLVCQQIGLPDHALRVANQERTYFVLRRMQVDAQGSLREMAWVQDPSTPDDKTKRIWLPLPDQNVRPQLAKDEELLPLFPVFIPKTATRPARRLHAGLIPTSSRETLTAAAAAGSSPSQLAVAEAQQRVIAALEQVVTSIDHVLLNNGLSTTPTLTSLLGVAHPPPPPNPPPLPDPTKLAAPSPPEPDPAIEMIAQASTFLALDLADVLNKYVPDVFAAIVSGGVQPAPGTDSRTLLDTLRGAVFDPTQNAQWSDAITAAWAAKDAMNDPAHTSASVPTFNLFYAAALPSKALNYGVLEGQLTQAIATLAPAPVPPDPAAASLIVPRFDGNATYVVRCVFQRCVLKGQKYSLLYPATLSDASQPFEIAPFFDTDAPARTIRIPMPIDTSPSGLRKFPKSVGFLLSDKLQQQICQASDFAGLLKGQLGSCPPLQMGQICSFSIPIITIIAMLLMMLMAIVLNFVFWWLPFLKICLPVPYSAATHPEEA